MSAVSRTSCHLHCEIVHILLFQVPRGYPRPTVDSLTPHRPHHRDPTFYIHGRERVSVCVWVQRGNVNTNTFCKHFGTENMSWWFRNHNNTEFIGTTSTDNLFNGNQNEKFHSRSISRKDYIVNFEIVQRCLLLGRILLPSFFLILLPWFSLALSHSPTSPSAWYINST